MKAQKFKVTIVVEALSIDAVPGLINQAVDQIDREMTSGELCADDGDQVIWETEQKSVTF